MSVQLSQSLTKLLGGLCATLCLCLPGCDPPIQKRPAPPSEAASPTEAKHDPSPAASGSTTAALNSSSPSSDNTDPTGSRGQATPPPDPAPVEQAPRVELRKPTGLDRPKSLRAKDRVRGAHEAKDAVVRQLFADAGLQFPPKQMLLRAFKKEHELEVWASDRKQGPLKLVANYKICALSGVLGPKKAEGDFQVPEGFYTLNLFNRSSSYHLSMRISYPNRRDRKLGYTGSAIMIHGDCVSIGCLAMSDERIEELWVMATATHDQQQKVHVHMFPQRDLDKLLAEAPNAGLKAFWQNLKQGKELFEKDFTIPTVSSNAEGVYEFR